MKNKIIYPTSFYTFSIIFRIDTDWQTDDVVVNCGKSLYREKQVSGKKVENIKSSFVISQLMLDADVVASSS